MIFGRAFNRVFGARALGKRPIKKFNKRRDGPPWNYFFPARFVHFFPSNFSYFLRALSAPLTSSAVSFFRPHLATAAALGRPSSARIVSAAASNDGAAADDTSGIRHTRKRQNYTLNIYDKPNPLSTLKTHQPFLSVYTIKTRSQQDAVAVI